MSSSASQYERGMSFAKGKRDELRRLGVLVVLAGLTKDYLPIFVCEKNEGFCRREAGLLQRHNFRKQNLVVTCQADGSKKIYDAWI